jgi:hypothetical protein
MRRARRHNKLVTPLLHDVKTNNVFAHLDSLCIFIIHETSQNDQTSWKLVQISPPCVRSSWIFCSNLHNLQTRPSWWVREKECAQWSHRKTARVSVEVPCFTRQKAALDGCTCCSSFDESSFGCWCPVTEAYFAGPAFSSPRCVP